MNDNGNNDGVVIFGGQPLENTTNDNTVPSDNTNSAVSSVIPTVPLVNESVSNSNEINTTDTNTQSVSNPVPNVEVAVPPVDVSATTPSNTNTTLSFDLPSSVDTTTTPSVNNENITVDNSGITMDNTKTDVSNPVPNDSPSVVVQPSVDTQPISNNLDTISHSNVVSLGKYLGHMFLFSIPLIGFIFLLVKAFDKKDENISNFAKATLVFGVLIVAILFILTFVFVALGLTNISVNTYLNN